MNSNQKKNSTAPIHHLRAWESTRFRTVGFTRFS